MPPGSDPGAMRSEVTLQYYSVSLLNNTFCLSMSPPIFAS